METFSLIFNSISLEIMYKELVLNYLKRFRSLEPYDIIRLNRYYVEYLRELAIANGINPVTEFKWTNKIIELYNSKGYSEVGEMMMILDICKDIMPLYITHTDFRDTLKLTITDRELDIVKNLLVLLNK